MEAKIELHDDELIRRYQAGDASAFNTLVMRHDRKVLNIAARYTRCPEDAKDLYQEVFTRAYKGLERFRFQSEFSTWLYRITTNVCLTYRARCRKNQYVSLDSDDCQFRLEAPGATANPGHDTLRRREISQHLAAALDTLSPKQKMAFVMKHYEGMKIREIAGFMGCTEGAIKRYLFTAIDKLRNRLKEFVD